MTFVVECVCAKEFGIRPDCDLKCKISMSSEYSNKRIYIRKVGLEKEIADLEDILKMCGS